jgi:hypothetical protein
MNLLIVRQKFPKNLAAIRKDMKINHFLISSILMLSCHLLPAQSVSFDLKTSPSADFTFNTIEKCVNGIIMPHVLDLNVNVTGSEWDLYVGTTTTGAGTWNVSTTYSTTGIATPPVSILQARIYNPNGTSLTGGGFFALTDIATPTYMIGSISNNPAVSCSDPSPVGTNQPGSYTSDPSCYKFRVDLKLTPGLTYRPGLYTLRVDFILIEDL